MRFVFFFNDTATPEIYALTLHDARPICHACEGPVEYVWTNAGGQRLGAEHRLPFGKAHRRLDFEIAVVRLRDRIGSDRGGFGDVKGGGLKRGGDGSGGLLRTGDQYEKAGSGDQLADMPTTGKAKGHSGVHRDKP